MWGYERIDVEFAERNVMTILDDIHLQKRELALQIESSIKDTYRNMLSCYMMNYQRIWSNDMGLTPQEVCDALGVHAAETFQLAELCKQALNTAKPGTISLTPPFTITINPDGTVTLTDNVSQ